MDCPPKKKKKNGCYREVAVSGSSTEVIAHVAILKF